MKAAGLTTSLDTNDDPDDRWDGELDQTLPSVDVLLLNAHEATRTARAANLEEALEKLSKRTPVLVVKTGAEGAIARRGREEYRTRPRAVETVDAVGAGDSFDAGFLHQFLRGADLERCIAFGSLAGAFSTTRPGGTEAFRDRAHFEEFFSHHSTAEADALPSPKPAPLQAKP